MSAMDLPDFLHAFQSRRDQCRALLELSRRQQTLIGNDDYTQLLVVLGQKQLILGRLDEMKSRHAAILSRWQSQRDRLESGPRSDCEHLLAETESILAELVQEEESSTRHIIHRRDRARSELQAVSEGGQVNHAYRDALAPATNRHLDLNR